MRPEVKLKATRGRFQPATRDIAVCLGRLAKSLEVDGHSAAVVAAFLMRALFTMFAEDVELLPRESFLDLLKSRRGRLDTFVPKVEELWSRMLDCFGLTEHELQTQYSSVFQHLFDHVKPERDHNSLAKDWTSTAKSNRVAIRR